MLRLDSHTHLMLNRPEELLRQAREDYGYEKINVLGIPCYLGPLNNLECLRVKAQAPDYAYVYGGMVYTPDTEPSGADHEKQLQLMLEAGFDGWKILESKPACYKNLQLPLDGPVFDRAFALAQENATPILWHAGDPATFWSEETAPEFAVKNHWLCVGEGYPALETLYGQVEAVLDRYPGLCVTLAHMFFTTDDRPHAEGLLAAHPNLRLDLTPGCEMYGHFTQDAPGWRAFFDRWQDRLIFGTDMVDNPVDDVFGSQKAIVELVMKALTTTEDFSIAVIAGRGIGLEEKLLQKLFRENFVKIQPHPPKAISRSGLEAYGSWLLPRLSPQEQKRAETLLEELL